MKLNETVADFFYNDPDMYLECIKAGAEYLKEEPYPKNNKGVDWYLKHSLSTRTARDIWWMNALKSIKDKFKDYYGAGFTKIMKTAALSLADEGNTSIENVQQYVSSGTCEQYEIFMDCNKPNNLDAGGLYINESTKLKESYSSWKKYVVKGDKATWVGFYYNKTDAKRCLKPFTGKNQTILAEELVPETVTQEIVNEYPIVVNIHGGNSTWSDDIQRHLYMDQLGIKCYNKQLYPVYLIKDEQAVKDAIKNVVYEMYRVRQPASSCIGYKIDWSVGSWNIKWSSIDKNKYDRPICQNCGAPLSKEEIETYGDTCEACALDDIGRDRNYDGPDVGDLFESIIRESNDWDDDYDEDPEITDMMRKSLGWKMTVRDACECGWNSVRVYEEDGIAFYDPHDNTFTVDCYDGPDNEFLDMEVQLDDFWQEDEDGYPIIYGTKVLQEGTNTKKRNYIDIKGEKAPLDWDRIDDKIEKIGFGKDLHESTLREDEIKSWYEPFRNFCYQIYNGGVSQPLGLNPHYYKDICALLDELPSGGIIEKIYLEKNIPDEWVPLLEKFVKEVCELCNAVSEADFYKNCNYCDGSGEEYIMDEDEDGNDHSYYDTCDMCGGTGILSCHIDEMDDIDDAKSCLSKAAQEYWDDLDNNVLEYCDMFKAIEGKE